MWTGYVVFYVLTSTEAAIYTQLHIWIWQINCERTCVETLHAHKELICEALHLHRKGMPKNT